MCTRFRAGVAQTEDNGGVPQTLKLRSPLLKTQKLLINVLSFKAGVGQNTVLHASPTAMNPALLISPFPVRSATFSPVLFNCSVMRTDLDRNFRP